MQYDYRVHHKDNNFNAIMTHNMAAMSPSQSRTRKSSKIFFTIGEKTYIRITQPIQIIIIMNAYPEMVLVLKIIIVGVSNSAK